MRTIKFTKNNIVSTIRTNDEVCDGFGKCYLDIAFEQGSSTIPSKVTILYSDKEFTQAVYLSQLSTEQLDGCYFDLSWFKWLAPKYATKTITLIIQYDGVNMRSIQYIITRGKGEVVLNPSTIIFGIEDENADYIDKTFNVDDICNLAPTQLTPHWRACEFMSRTSDVSLLIGGILASKPLPLGYSYETIGNTLWYEIVGTSLFDSKIIAKGEFQENNCCDIELRITNRHGLRGVIGGKIVADKAEGGDEQKTNKFTTIAGVYYYRRASAEIKIDVAFAFNGNADLLGLLRDGCVYGEVEWYCEQSQEWLPCLIEDNSIDMSDAYAEQVITIKLQSL